MHDHISQDHFVTDPRLKIAVFVDFDNIEIGVKSTLNQSFDIGVVLEAIKERGEVVTKVAYSDWKRAGDYSRQLSQHAIRMVQRNLTPGGDKNGADINLALDALEMAFTHDHINAFVIVGGDSDFMTLVEKLKQYDKKVFVVGGRQFTSVVMQRNCHEFIAYENLVGTRRGTSGGTGRARTGAGSAAVDLEKALPLVKRALKVLSDREVTPQLGLLKSTLLQLDSTFSERDYGASTFRDFIEKVAERGLVSLKQAGRSVLVELSDSPLTSAIPEAAAETRPLQGEVVEGAVVAAESGDLPAGEARHPDADQARPQPVSTEQQTDAVQRAARLFAGAKQVPRWPMYIRQIRQYLRNADETFDERKLGFTGIVEFLRACQREGLLRLERDRQGVMRVFAGAAFGRAAEQTRVETDGAGALELPRDEAPEFAAAERVVDMSEAALDADARPVPVALDTIEPPVAVEEDLSVGPGNVARPGEAPIARKRTRTTGARAPRKTAAPRGPRPPRARKAAPKP
jgi:uncharacterized LabA/DUF88 family protein